MRTETREARTRLDLVELGLQANYPKATRRRPLVAPFHLGHARGTKMTRAGLGTIHRGERIVALNFVRKYQYE